jgi:hypothetical protein
VAGLVQLLVDELGEKLGDLVVGSGGMGGQCRST